jgi:hypothetical protein
MTLYPFGAGPLGPPDRTPQTVALERLVAELKVAIADLDRQMAETGPHDVGYHFGMGQRSALNRTLALIATLTRSAP